MGGIRAEDMDLVSKKTQLVKGIAKSVLGRMGFDFNIKLR